MQKKHWSDVQLPTRETGVSHHHENPIEDSLKSLGQSQHYRIERFKWGPQFGLCLCKYFHAECLFSKSYQTSVHTTQ